LGIAHARQRGTDRRACFRDAVYLCSFDAFVQRIRVQAVNYRVDARRRNRRNATFPCSRLVDFSAGNAIARVYFFDAKIARIRSGNLSASTSKIVGENIRGAMRGERYSPAGIATQRTLASTGMRTSPVSI